MTAQAKLFNTNSMPLGQLAEAVEKQLTAKCQTYHVSFGIFKTKRGFIDHNAMLVITSMAGHHFTVSVSAESLHDMFAQVHDQLNEIK